MADFDTLCQVTSAHVGNAYVWVGRGLATGLAAQLYVVDDNPTNPTDVSASLGLGTVRPDGYATAVGADGVPHNYARLVIHQAVADPTLAKKINRVSNEWSLNVLAAGPSDPAFATPVVLTGEATHNAALLTWTPSSVCDARATAGYNVYQGSSSSLGSKIAGPLTARGFLVTGLVNGTTYWFRIESLAMLAADLIFSPLGAANATNISNPVSVTPATRREYVGAVVDR